MWCGTYSTVPQGWVICDGTNGTPNLTNRFPLGASNSDRLKFRDDGIHQTYDNNSNTGGDFNVQIEARHVPEHLGYPKNTSGRGSSSNCSIIDIQNGPDRNARGMDKLNVVPPYAKVYFIMKNT